MEFYEMTARNAAKKLGSDTARGLDETEARKRLISHGRNILKEGKKRGFFRRFAAQFDDFMIIVLLCAATISFFTSLAAGERDITEPLIILAIVTLNAVLGTVQEIRAEHSLESLKKLSTPHALVIRGGKEYRISSEEIVPGDVLRIRTGDMVCADCRIISSESLTVNESSLTGESHAAEKNGDIVYNDIMPIGDTKNMLMTSSSVLSGNALALAVKTGMDTEVGKIASLLTENEPNETPLQKKLATVGRNLGVAALMICGIIFIVGTVKHIPPLEMFMTSVSLAVAAIPEGLPAIVTVMLAMGLVRMSSHNAIVRNLPSVETLGCATVICTDKTGTLTQNKMKVRDIKSRDENLLSELCVLCSETGDFINPTDKAILEYALKKGTDIDKCRSMYPLTQYIPFDSQRKRMSVKCGDRVIVKGALEYILPLCTKIRLYGKDGSLTKKEKNNILNENEKMTADALRVIACAYKTDKNKNAEDEKNLVFVGLIGIVDPPRKEATAAVKMCHRAGIRTVMITGDHSLTAAAIAKAVGICNEAGEVMTGGELDALNDKELCEAVKRCNVYARVSPVHKSRIVKALKSCGEVVAMTGDGVNDAPALSAADIGCSMGISGTDVAKSASDMILTDDNFATIVYAVREGRTIYDNIKKAIRFLLSSNIGEILAVLFSIIFGYAAPFTAIELLWVNLVTDSLPAIALGLDPPAENIMERKPLDSKKSIFSGGMWSSIIIEGFMIGAIALAAYGIGLIMTHEPVAARTMSFFVLGVSQLVHAFNMRSEQSVFKEGIFKNKYLLVSFLIGILAQFALMTLPSIAEIFDICPIDAACSAVCVALSLLPLFIVELQKFFGK